MNLAHQTKLPAGEKIQFLIDISASPDTSIYNPGNLRWDCELPRDHEHQNFGIISQYISQPPHSWFSYSSYFPCPRVCLDSTPIWWRLVYFLIFWKFLSLSISGYSNILSAFHVSPLLQHLSCGEKTMRQKQTSASQHSVYCRIYSVDIEGGGRSLIITRGSKYPNFVCVGSCSW